MDLTDAQWTRLAPRVPTPRTRPDGRGRPWRDPRDVLHGVRTLVVSVLCSTSAECETHRLLDGTLTSRRSIDR